MANEYLDIIGLGIFKALNDKRYPILVNGKISESAIPTSITNSITSILSLIPDAASSENKLADKNFVNSSIATNTATFRGTFDDLATLQATSADINDYAFYVHTDEIGNTAYDRYKHNGSTWVFEYTLNNSSFTAEQWSAINSGITTTKVGNYDAHLINYSNPHKVTKSQVGLGNVENVALSSWAGSNKITTLGTITTGVWNGSKIGNDYLANSSITIGTTAISLGSTAKSLAGIEKLQLNDANSNLIYDSTTGSWKLTGNLLVTGFISAGAKGNSSSGGGSTYTQREWAEIKIMSASEIGLLASAYSVKEAYEELNTAIETLAGKATNVKFTQTLTSGKQIGSISIDGKSTSLYAPANYAWSEITGKPTFATVATSGSYTDLTNKPTIASLMGSAAIGGTSSYLYWNGSAWATKALGSNAFTSISKVSQLTNDSGYISGITKSMVEGVLTGNITSHTHSYIPLADKGLSNGKVPYYVEFPDHKTLVSLGYNEESTSTNDEAYFKGLCKWAIDNFAGQGKGQIILIGNAIPNSGGFCYIQLYSTAGKDATTGLPRYCSGTYISLDRATTNFGCINYIWTFGGRFYGNASSSSKWANARTITLTGSVTGSVSIDGSANVSLATTTNHTHTFASLTSKPTTISGYGITDALTSKYITYKQDFQQYVILLCQIGTNTTNFHHTINGTFWAAAAGASRYQAAYINVHCADWTNSHNEYYGFTPFGLGTKCRLVTCTYQSSKYLAITFESTQAIYIFFDGSYRNILFTPILYYTSNTSTVENSEIYNSITEVTYNKIPLISSAETALTTSNYNSYAPSLTGSGASGTWGISISGNAATVGGITGALIPATDVSTGYWGSLGYGSSKKLSIGTNYGGVAWTAQNYCAGLMFGCDLDTHGFISIGYNSPIVSFAGSNNSNASNDNPNWYFKLKGTTGTTYDLNCAPAATKLANSRTIWGQSFDGTGNVSGALSGVTDINKVLHINSSGNVTIGNSDLAGTNHKLYVGGKIRTQYINLENGNEINCFLDNGDSAPLCLNYDSSGNIILGFGGGNVGIGTISSPAYKLHIVGTAYASEGLVSDGYISGAATATSSDIRLKDNISEISSEMALKWLSMLKPKSWSWNSLAGVKGRSMGFVAQDVEGILPQMIRKRRDNDYLSLDYTQLHALEVSALQSHEKRIEELERENKILKEELNKLKLYAN